MSLTTSKEDAVKVKLIWNSKYAAVTFIGDKENAILNNLNSLNYCYNWYHSSYTFDTNCSYHVYIPTTAPALQAMTLNANKMTLKKLSSAVIRLAYAPADARVEAISVKSSDESIVSVSTSIDADGSVGVKVNGCAEGTATITAETFDGSQLSASCTITVVDAPDNTTQTKITGLDELTAGSTIRIYPYEKDGIAELALCSNATGAELTSTEKAAGGSNIWTLEDAGDSCFYLVNKLGQYWAYQQSNYSFQAMTVASSKDEAVKVRMVWNENFPGVAFRNGRDSAYLNNLYTYNYRYNWYKGAGAPLAYDSNNTYHVYLCHETQMLNALAFDTDNLSLKADTTVAHHLVYDPAETDAAAITLKSSDESVVSLEASAAANGTIAFTLTSHKLGAANITAEATDGSGLSVSFRVYVTATGEESSWTKVTEALMPSLAEGYLIKIYPYGHGGEEQMALSSNATDALLTSNEKSSGAMMWTFTDAGDGYFYVANELGQYWAFQQSNSSSVCMTLATSVDGATRVKPIWNEQYEGVSFICETNNAVLNNLYGWNYRYNWYGTDTGGQFPYATYDVYFLKGIEHPITSIKLSQTSVYLYPGDSLQLSATVSPDNAGVKTLAWMSSNEAVATVSQEGHVAAVAPGEAIITAEALDGSGLSASCELTVIGDSVDMKIDSLKYRLYLRADTATVVSNGSRYSGDIVIPSEVAFEGQTYRVTALARECFNGCTELNSIVIPSSVKTLGASSFGNCYNLKSAILPEGITSLPGNCFVSCRSLQELTIPSTVTRLEDGALGYCESLRQLIIPDKVTYIGRNCFWFTNAIQQLTCQAPTPPECPSIMPIYCETLYVYEASLEAYKAAYPWQNIQHILPIVTQVTLPASIAIEPQQSDSLLIALQPDSATVGELTWTSSNEAVATVDSMGVVTGIALGTATITATAKDGLGATASCEVSVVESTAINGIASNADVATYYTLDGIKLQGKPQKEGVYIRNTDGKSEKVVVKRK